MRPIDAVSLSEGIDLHRQSTDQDCEMDRQWAVGYNAGLDRALYSIAYAKTITPPPNDPLTPEELREMDGEPVWVDDIVFRRDRSCGGLWAIVVLAYDEIVFGDRDSMPLKDVVGFAYRRKPEEGTV